MSKKLKKVCRVLNYIDCSVSIVYTITGSLSISAFASFVGTPIGITIFAIGLKICAITAEIKKNKSIIKKKKKHDKIVLLAKSKLSTIKVSISKGLIDSNINYDESVLINNILKEFYDMKEEIKNFNNK